MKKLLPLLPLALLLSACNDNGYANTDLETITIGVVFCVLILSFAAVAIAIIRR